MLVNYKSKPIYLFFIILFVFCILLPVSSSEANQPVIIPFPKKMNLLGKDMAIDKNTLIVVGDNVHRKVKIGVEEINKKCQSLFNFSLSRIEASQISTAEPKSLIVIGNPYRETWLKDYYDQCTIKLKNRYLGKQGYIIDFLKKGKNEIVCIFGEDPQGLLYGCISLCCLLSKKGEKTGIVCAIIFDKPDFKYRMAGNLKFYYLFHRQNATDIIDLALKHKINMIWSGFYFEKHMALHTNRKWFRYINNYAWERGIRIIYASRWSIGKAPIPDVSRSRYYSFKGMIGHRGLLYCWNNDSLLAKKCSRITQFIKDVNPKAFYFHPIDTGGPKKNPELWKNRCAATRERFGDDRAAADAHIINTLYQTVKKADPDIIFTTVVYPYHPNTLKHKKVKKWLIRLSSLIPSDVYICIREATRINVEEWKNLSKQPNLFYHQTESRDWETRRPFITSFRFAKTFFFPQSRDIYWYLTGYPRSIVKFLGAAEYGWNTTAPGAELLTSFEKVPSWKQATNHKPQMAAYFLPKVTEVLFGSASAEMSKVISYNLSPHLMAKPQKWIDKRYCRGQLENSRKTIKLLENARNKIGTDNYFFRVIETNSLATRYLAEARLSIIEAKEYAMKLDFNKASSSKKHAKYIIDVGYKSFVDFTGGSPRFEDLDYDKLKKTILNELKTDFILKKL